MTTETMDREPVSREAMARYEPSRGDGEVPETKIDLSLDPATYIGMSTEPVTEAQAAILTRPLDPADIDIRPDGAVYMGHAKLRQRLNEAFRPGGWAIRRLSTIDATVATPAQQNRKAELVMSAEFALYAGGRFLASARGEQKYMDNGEMTYGDACEGMKSNALSRCCKDLGIALDLWDRAYADRFRNEHGVKVWGENRDGQRWWKPQWRRVDGLPLYGETGPTDDSPNQDRYVYPQNTRGSRQPQQAPPPAPPRSREPGEDDDPVPMPSMDRDRPEPPRQEPPRQNGGRTISEAQQRRLWAKATREAGMSQDEYRDFLRGFGYSSDREIRVADYDRMVDAAVGGR